MSISNWRKAKLGDIADMRLGKMLDKEKNKDEYQASRELEGQIVNNLSALKL